MKIKNKRYINEVCISCVIAVVFSFITFCAMNIQIPISSEKGKLQFFETLRKYYLSHDESNFTDSDIMIEKESFMSDSVIMIDTHYDQQFVLERKLPGMMETGLVPVTDRRKLLRCLEYLKERNDYKYILLDIFLDKEVRQEEDSSLYKTIASMQRIAIARPQDILLADTCMAPKSGTVQYKIALWENDFVKYPYIYKGEKSLPMMMYEDITGRTITKKGPFYWDKGLVRNSVILTFDNHDVDEPIYLGGTEDLTIEAALDDCKGKYILIGDFVDDFHNTYIGAVPGTLINYYAFLALLHGRHKLSIGIVLFFILIFAIPIYLKITDNRIPKWIALKTCNSSFVKWAKTKLKALFPKRKNMEKPEVLKHISEILRIVTSKLLSSWIGIPLYLTIVCFITYLVFHEAYDILITTVLFYLLNLIWDSYREVKTKKE